MQGLRAAVRICDSLRAWGRSLPAADRPCRGGLHVYRITMIAGRGRTRAGPAGLTLHRRAGPQADGPSVCGNRYRFRRRGARTSRTSVARRCACSRGTARVPLAARSAAARRRAGQLVCIACRRLPASSSAERTLCATLSAILRLAIRFPAACNVVSNMAPCVCVLRCVRAPCSCVWVRVWVCMSMCICLCVTFCAL